MVELELSIMPNAQDPAESVPALADFEARHHVRVRVNVLASWPTAWADLVRMALYKQGADVSQAGSTWVSNFLAMRALRPFTPREAAGMGGESAFLPAIWQTCLPGGESEIWAIPWLTDTRVLFYRRDLLERAGIDEQTAFRSMDALEDTLRRLQASGVTNPWIVPTARLLITVHNLASWIWGAGGDFVSADGKRILFNQKEALAGIRAYFALHRYLPPGPPRTDPFQAQALIQQDQAAVTISGPWEIPGFQQDPTARATVGAALMPGVPFVGGSDLVIWNHTRHPEAAVELVRFLTSREAQIAYAARANPFPARLDAVNAPRFANDPLYRVATDSLRVGRAFPAIPLWGLIEDGLTAACAWIWADLLANPDIDLDTVIRQHLDPLARRLNLTLSG
ncbi:MAG TPA: extracellular solute-binding protein [Anaerolineae bacterium]